MRTSLFLCAVLFLASSLSGDVIHVEAGGRGTVANSVQSAIDAASNGDILILGKGREIGEWRRYFHPECFTESATGTFVDFALIGDAEAAVNETRFQANLDGNPRFFGNFPDRIPQSLNVSVLRLRSTSPARNRGAGESRFRDRNGSRNDLGHTGGPLGWR